MRFQRAVEVHAVPVSLAQTSENPVPWRPTKGRRGASGGGERFDQSSEGGEGQAGKEPSQEALRRTVGDATEEAAHRAVKEAA